MFKAGDKVVCVNPDGWMVQGTRTPCDGPEYNEELIIDGFDDIGWLLFSKYGTDKDSGFYPNAFRKIDFTFGSEVAERIEEIIKEEELVNA